MSINNLPPKYNPEAVEGKWYEYWMQHNMFHSVPDGREPYSIVIPPPNVTGVLHMGHMLNNTIQDILVRRARIQGKNAIWFPAPKPLLKFLSTFTTKGCYIAAYTWSTGTLQTLRPYPMTK